MSPLGGKADIDQPLLTNLDLLVHGLDRIGGSAASAVAGAVFGANERLGK
jgi:hypothetical protein